MADKCELKQEELERVSGGAEENTFDPNGDPLVDPNNHGNKKEYMVDYSAKGNLANSKVTPDVKSHFIGWHDTLQSAIYAGRHWCTENDKQFLSVRLARKDDNKKS